MALKLLLNNIWLNIMGVYMQRKAYGKINWALRVLNKRLDGYHDLDTIMQSISLYDTVSLKPQPFWEVTVNQDCIPTGESIPVGKDNIAYQAAVKYVEYAGISDCFAIHIDKHIPVQAGLGGGSADAAAVLNALQEHYQALDDQTIKKLADHLGADVPFSLSGGLARCQGKGEKIQLLKAQEFNLLLIKPSRGVLTTKAFSVYDIDTTYSNNKAIYEMSAMEQALQYGSADDVAKLIVNDLLHPAIIIVPEIGVIIEKLVKIGALCAGMSGSGSCCFGLFTNQEKAQDAKLHFTDYPFVAVCKTIS